MRKLLIETLTQHILAAKQSQSTPLLVGIDGIDASGKTHLGDQLYKSLQLTGCRVIRSTVDNFHNPRDIRYQRGKLSPEGYYYDSFNYEKLKQCLLEPLSPHGNRQYRTAQFDHRSNAEIDPPVFTAGEEEILICDGIFLFRADLLPYWDVKIFVDISFETCLLRALSRDLDLLGDHETIIRNYQHRYIPGQKLYFDLEHPKEKADVLIDNNDHQHPRIAFLRKQ